MAADQPDNETAKPRYRSNPSNMPPKGGRAYSGIGDMAMDTYTGKDLSRTLTDTDEDARLSKTTGPIAPKRLTAPRSLAGGRR